VVGGGGGAVAAALYSIGIPRDSCLQYESAVKSAKFLVIAHGTEDQVAAARSILHMAGAEQIGVHPEVCRELASIT
jgi:uncharacterized membrane protein